MKTRFSTIEQVWEAIENGKEVFWCNDSYHLTIENPSHNREPISLQ